MSIYRINQSKDGKTTVERFDSKREAQSKGNAGHLVSSVEDLSENFALTTSMMRDAYNVLNPEKQVTRFSDREAACRRLWSALQALSPSSPEKAAEGAAPERKSKKEKAKKGSKAPKAPKKEKASRGAKKPSRRAVPLYVPKGTENPYRVATQSFKAFELAIANPGKTFAELIELGGRGNTLSQMMRLNILNPKA